MYPRPNQNRNFKANTVKSNYSRISKYSSFYEKSSSINLENINHFIEEEKNDKYLVQIVVPKFCKNLKALSKSEIFNLIHKKIKNSNVFIPKEIDFKKYFEQLNIPQNIFNSIMINEIYNAMNDNCKLSLVSIKNNLGLQNTMLKKYEFDGSDENDNYSIDSFYNDKKTKKIYSREMDMINHMMPEVPNNINKYVFKKKGQTGYNKNNDFEIEKNFCLSSTENEQFDKDKQEFNDNSDICSKIVKDTIKDNSLTFQNIIPIISTLSKTNYQNVLERDNSPIRRTLSSSIYVPRKIIDSRNLNVEIVNVISPSFIYVREINHIAKNLTIKVPMDLKVIKSEMEDIIHYNADELFKIQNCNEPFLWRYCMAPLDEKSLGRARIIQKMVANNSDINSDMIDNLFVKVFFLDYGTTTWVYIKCCYLFPYPEWYSYPPQVIPITLIDIAPKYEIGNIFESTYKWKLSICNELSNIISKFKNFEVSIINVYAQKINKLFTYGGYLYGCESIFDENNDQENITKVNISSALIWKCFDEILHKDNNSYFEAPNIYDVDVEYIVDFNSLPNYLKNEHKLVRIANIITTKKMSEHFTDDNYKNNRKIRIPPLLVSLDVWPRGNLPWDYDTLVYSGFVNNNTIGFIVNDSSSNINCFSFSVIPILNYQIEQSFVEDNVICNQIDKILKAKKMVEDVLNDFYRIKENRRCFNWEYVQGKLELYEPVNCIVGLMDENYGYNFNCRRARIHYLIENFAEEFDLYFKGIVPTHRKKHIRYVIVELYDYADVIVVPTDSICQIHPMHDIINPFSLRMCMDYDIGNIRLTKIKKLGKLTSPEVISLKKILSEIVCIGTPKRAILQGGPSVGMKKRYKFEYFIHPWKDPFSYKIRYITELWSDKTIFLDKKIFLSNQYFKNLHHCTKLEYLQQFNKIPTVPNYNNQRSYSIQKKKSLLTKGITHLKTFQSYNLKKN
ncbi:Tudor domain-containing protein [Strongyloides ratti]|uniref:Tudor domain-containing protein n=1 Tax=Strongyloides ratti TaxID=34506 RepID=A0A090LRM1_STRRB|nr:Tudor domain-containing protein [Strongyloides ratti]CEF70206.1 Tudor domain-containing protein [Strongyloides ratti]